MNPAPSSPVPAVEAERIELPSGGYMLHDSCRCWNIYRADGHYQGLLFIDEDGHAFAKAMSSPTPGRAVEPETMGEVERLAREYDRAATCRAADDAMGRSLEAQQNDAAEAAALDALLSAVRTIVTERDESYRRHAIRTKEACNLASEVGRLLADAERSEKHRNDLYDSIVSLKTERSALRTRAETAEALVRDHEAAAADKRRLAREIDVAMHGEDGAAAQPSLCDLVGSAQDLSRERDALRAQILTLRAIVETAKVPDFLKTLSWAATPGQWTYEPDPYRPENIRGASGAIVAQAVGDDAETMADAGLIAASVNFVRTLLSTSGADR